MLKRTIYTILQKFITLLLVAMCAWVAFYAFEQHLTSFPLFLQKLYAWLPKIISIITSIIILFVIIYAILIYRSNQDSE